MKDFESFLNKQTIDKTYLTEGFVDLSEDQENTIKMRSKRISQTFLDEVERLINSGGVSKDRFDNYPLPDIFKVALENIAAKEGVTDPKAYKNLKKF